MNIDSLWGQKLSPSSEEQKKMESAEWQLLLFFWGDNHMEWLTLKDGNSKPRGWHVSLKQEPHLGISPQYQDESLVPPTQLSCPPLP